jgi:hypothetical protein
MSRKGSDFPKIELLESCKKWQKSFFYVKNTTAVDLLNLPPYVDVPPVGMKNWTYTPRTWWGQSMPSTGLRMSCVMPA